MLALASALEHVPEALDSVESAPLLCAGITTFNAVRTC
jgi:alcohol dehydrogenase